MFLRKKDNAEELVRTAGLISQSNHLVALTGAGCSTESGIPDFRSPGGLWKKYDPAVYADYSYFLKDPSRFWEMSVELLPLLENALPNAAHLALAKLEKGNILKTIITQNIDDLHQKAGSSKVIELHGSYRAAACLTCERDVSLDEMKRLLNKPYPECPYCRGTLKPKVILFGEALDPDILRQATIEAGKADLLLIIGTGLEIYPASFVPSVTKQHGGKLILINNERVSRPHKADIFLQGKAAEILPEILSLVNHR